MRYLKYLLGGMLTAALVACGGGGGNPGTSSGGSSGGTTSNVASIELSASATTLGSGDTTGITITAVLKDRSNNALASQPSSFSASSGGLAGATATSDTAGRSTATLTAGADRSNRNITVTVSSGSVSKTLVVPVVGTTLTVAGGGSVLIGASATYNVSVKDSAGNGVAGAALTVASSLGNGLGATALTTDTSGAATVIYSATKAGTDTLTVTGQGAAVQYAVAVSSQDFAVTTPTAGAAISVNTPTNVQVRYVSGGAGVAGQLVYFSSSRGTVAPASATTDASGVAQTTLTSTTAGPATITAQIASSGSQTTQSVSFVATTPASISLQASPTAVSPNTAGSTAKSAALTAIVRDSAGNAVSGRTVNFSILADTSGGSLASGTAVTDANGTVSTLFYPGTTATASNGVQISATVIGTTITSTATLTVSNQAVFISFQYGVGLAELNTSTYSMPIGVSVTDVNGAPVTNQTINLSVYPTTYGKGYKDWNGAVWTIYPPSYVSCVNEDVNRNGILDSGEDTNGNGSLTPGMPVLVTPATVTTDSSGQATFALNYGKQFGQWVSLALTARTTVSGTESSANSSFSMPVLSSDVSTETLAPPGQNSPFGTGSSCTVPN